MKLYSPQHFRKQLNTLRTEEKIMAFLGLAILTSCFLPWRTGTPLSELYLNNTEHGWFETWTDTGFKGATWLFGWFISFFTLSTTLMLLNPRSENFINQKFSISRYHLTLYLSLQMTLLFILATSVLLYSKSDQELGFGLFFGMLSTIALLFISYFSSLRTPRHTHTSPSKDNFLTFEKPTHRPHPSQTPDPNLEPEDPSNNSSPQQPLNL